MIFLDLENTVIESWDCLVPMQDNINAIEKYISNDDSIIGVFSFAIWDSHDVSVFMRDVYPLLPILTERLGIVMHMDDLKKKLSEEFHVTVVDEDFVTFLRKEYAFEIYVKFLVDAGLSENEFVLIDDVVPDRTVIMKVRGKDITVRTVNVKTIIAEVKND